MPAHQFLLCALLLCNVALRTFTNELRVLPKILNVIDIPLVGCIVALSLVTVAASQPSWVSSIRRRLVVFLLCFSIAGLLNFSYIYVPAALSQFIMLAEPVVLFLALCRLPFNQDQIASYSKLLRRLIVIEIIIGIFQLPSRFQTGDSEAVHGTFPGNAEQYAAFLMIGVFYLLALAILNPEKKKRYLLGIGAVLVLTLSIDNKASWLGTCAALGLLLWRLEVVRTRHLRFFAPVVALTLVIGLVAFVASQTSNTLYKFENVYTAIKEGDFLRLGKVKSYRDILSAYLENPHMALVGAGPATFYSRASRQFYFRGDSSMFSNPELLGSDMVEAFNRSSDSMGGWIPGTSQPAFYHNFYGQGDTIVAVGSGQVDGPYSPYAGLLGESGLVGTWLYLGMYLIVLKRLWTWLVAYRHDPIVLPMISASFGFMVYVLANSVYGPFLETTRYTTILWSMVALVTIYVRSPAVELAQEEEPEVKGVGSPAPTPSWI